MKMIVCCCVVIINNYNIYYDILCYEIYTVANDNTFTIIYTFYYIGNYGLYVVYAIVY